MKRGQTRGRGEYRGNDKPGEEGERERGQNRERGRARGQTRGRPIEPVVSPGNTEARWHTSDEPDMPTFRPAQTPGPQLISTESCSARELFQLFLSPTVCSELKCIRS